MSATSPIEHLAAELHHDDPTTRCEAARQLARLAWSAQAAALPLVLACRRDDDARGWAVAALEHMGPPDPSAVAPLGEMLGDPSPLVASWAATLLGRLGPQAAKCNADLSRTLVEHTDLHVREQAAWVLGRIGASARCAIPALNEAAGCEHSRLARVAERALRNVVGEPT